MTDLQRRRRARRLAPLLPTLWTPVRDVDCDGGATRKSLLRGHDGTLVESVTMRYADRTTVCVSSQAGCGMACPFCATGQAGPDPQPVDRRDRRAGRRARSAPRRAPAGRVSNVVFMGMGEPLANYARVVAAVRRITEPAPHGLGHRAAQRRRQHRRARAGDREADPRGAAGHARAEPARARRRAARHPRARSTPAGPSARCSRRRSATPAATGRRLSIEYALIRDVNDQPKRADLLGRLLKGKLVHVNLIPLNPTPGSEWDASPKPVEQEFVRRLKAAGVPTTVRDTRGQEIAGACGQLAALPV